jgi:hypothetical protein
MKKEEERKMNHRDGRQEKGNVLRSLFPEGHGTHHA